MIYQDAGVFVGSPNTRQTERAIINSSSLWMSRTSSEVSDSGAAQISRHLIGERLAQISRSGFSPVIDLFHGAPHFIMFS